MMRMHAGRREEYARMRERQSMRGARALRIGAGDHHLGYALRTRTRQHRIQVMGERLMAEVGADVDKLHGFAFNHLFNPASGAHYANFDSAPVDTIFCNFIHAWLIGRTTVSLAPAFFVNPS